MKRRSKKVSRVGLDQLGETDPNRFKSDDGAFYMRNFHTLHGPRIHSVQTLQRQSLTQVKKRKPSMPVFKVLDRIDKLLKEEEPPKGGEHGMLRRSRQGRE